MTMPKLLLSALAASLVLSSPVTSSAQDYANCPTNAQQLCDLFHTGTTPKNYCMYQECFDMSYAEEGRLVAADERGFFPKTWFMWHSGTLAPSGLFPCNVTRSGNKDRVEIAGVRCQSTLTTSGHLYYEHFVSNPTTGCLGWIECQQY